MPDCFKRIQKRILSVLIVCSHSCNGPEPTPDTEKNELSHAESLYYLCDTVIVGHDTVRIINTKLDTIITETGIFSYLQYDYPMHIPAEMVELSKKAVRMDWERNRNEAGSLFKRIIAYYNNDRLDDLKRFSDGNLYYRYENNCAILCSYAYEQLGHLEQAIHTLKPFLANCETRTAYCGINKRFIELCIRKYGQDKVCHELDHCGKTIQFSAEKNACRDNWTVNILGAKIGLEKPPQVERISMGMADSLVRNMNLFACSQSKNNPD